MLQINYYTDRFDSAFYDLIEVIYIEASIKATEKNFTKGVSFRNQLFLEFQTLLKQYEEPFKRLLAAKNESKVFENIFTSLQRSGEFAANRLQTNASKTDEFQEIFSKQWTVFNSKSKITGRTKENNNDYKKFEEDCLASLREICGLQIEEEPKEEPTRKKNLEGVELEEDVSAEHKETKFCILTQKNINEGVMCLNCNSVFDKEAILSLINSKPDKKVECPSIGCNNTLRTTNLGEFKEHRFVEYFKTVERKFQSLFEFVDDFKETDEVETMKIF